MVARVVAVFAVRVDAIFVVRVVAIFGVPETSVYCPILGPKRRYF